MTPGWPEETALYENDSRTSLRTSQRASWYKTGMCREFTQARSPLEIAARFGAELQSELPPLHPNVGPTDDALVLRFNPKTGRRHLDALRWGLIPRWLKDEIQAEEIGRKLFNARGETLDALPSFARPFESQRCLVPVDGFIEWVGDTYPKQPWAVVSAAEHEGRRDMLALAGIWDGWRHPKTGEWVRTFTVVTIESNALVREIHDRMPAILPEDAHARWLGETPARLCELQGLLVAIPPDALRIFPLARKVTSDDPDLLDAAG